ncbi:uncharacterized protein F4822DRAFT_441581 [Hypoxylon trugodes]|uniref:uncharacterized protein n=1 Tax=Hypoxylon trugodes TaxID=326681 RepID=UPI0021A2316D|nr:uncharacterized protein F4822DRAFT_441581 [Hypoxylon trugodes]KAI1392731.1 hypothetical protein F4822DRAFT_441581 [Hypoxylon trugodes]
MTSSSTSYPPLTTVFTPAPECSYITFTDCYYSDSCSAIAYTDNPDNCNGRVPQCFPVQSSSFESTTNYAYVTLSQTYSPGLYCPLYWETAASAISPDGVWCCPTGFSFNRDSQNCQATLTGGPAVTSDSCDTLSTFSFGPSVTSDMTVSFDSTSSSIFPLDNVQVSVSAGGIFLLGQTWANDPSKATATTPAASPPPGNENESPPSTKAVIGASVGGTIGGILLLGLGALLIMRYRRRRVGRVQEAEAAPKPHDGPEDYPLYKPELDGSLASPMMYTKQELDANATRSELEGPSTHNHAELGGNGIPAELQTDVVRAELE